MKLFNNIVLFLKKKDLIYMALAVYLGLVLQKLIESFIGDITLPIFNSALPQKIKSMNLNILNLNINNFMTQFLSTLLAIIVSYLFMKLVIR
tara:strand:- start:521 stop:796 length:276 start_codon:yes stop_codon:yes gene_type:complete